MALLARVAEGPDILANPETARHSPDAAPHDLRHSGVTWRLNSGIPAPEVAKWAGQRYLVAPRGQTQWVRNMLAARGGELRVGRRVKTFTATAWYPLREL